jgi:hypothetical protein
VTILREEGEPSVGFNDEITPAAKIPAAVGSIMGNSGYLNLLWERMRMSMKK